MRLLVVFGVILLISLNFVSSDLSNYLTPKVVVDSGEPTGESFTIKDINEYYSQTISINRETGELITSNISLIIGHNTSSKFIEKNVKEDSCDFCFISTYKTKFSDENGKTYYEYSGDCYPFGYRKDFVYCSDDEGDIKWISQKETSKECEYDFECKTNNCVEGICNNEENKPLQDKKLRIYNNKPLVLTIGNKDIMINFNSWTYGWELKINGKEFDKNIPYSISPRISLVNYNLDESKDFIDLEFKSDLSKCNGVSLNEDCLIDESVILEENDILNFTFNDLDYTFKIKFVNFNHFKFVNSGRESPSLNEGSDFQLSPYLNLKILKSDKTNGIEIFFDVSSDYLCEGYYFNNTCFQNGSTLSLEGKEYTILGHNLVQGGIGNQEDNFKLLKTDYENKSFSYNKTLPKTNEVQEDKSKFSFTGLITGFFTKIFPSEKEEVKSTNDKTIEEVLSKVNEIIDYNKNLSYTKQIYDTCSLKENGSEQILCINQFVKENFNYLPRDDVYSIDEMFIEGADCKSYSIYYATLSDMLGYTYSFYQTPNHIMTMVNYDGGYCVLDQKIGKCFDYIKGEIEDEE